MKLRLLLLLGSVALNAAFAATLVLRPSLAPAAVRDFLQLRSTPATAAADPRSAAAPKTTSGEATAKRTAEAKAQLWSALKSDDLATLVGRLRAAGFPAVVVRAIVDAELEARFAPRLKELTRAMQETPYWKPDPNLFSGNSQLFDQVNQIYRERSRTVRSLLGQDAFAYGFAEPSVAQRRQYGDIPPAKIDLVQRINDDYAEMTAQVRSAMQGVTLPEDREKLALLEREKRADLAAILSPEELNDYEMRTSRITGRLRTPLTIMDASEAEFRTIYQIQAPFADTLYPNSAGVISSDMMNQRREATQKMNEQIKAALGDARYEQYQRAANPEFQQLYNLGTQDNLPYATVARAFDLRAPTAETAMKIYNDQALSPEDRRTALQNLARETKTQLLSTLGPNVGPSYVENARWINYLEQGGAFTVMPDGNLSYRQPPRRAPAPGTGAANRK